MNRCWQPGYVLGCLAALLLGMGRAEAAISLGEELFLGGMVERVAQNTASPEADRLFEEGMQLYREGTAESLRLAIEKFEAALQLYGEAEIQNWEAVTLFNLARAYEDLGQKQEALNHYELALPLLEEIGME